MGDWDFLHGLEGQELLNAQATGATDWDWRYVEEEEAIKRRREEHRAKKQSYAADEGGVYCPGQLDGRQVTDNKNGRPLHKKGLPKISTFSTTPT